MKTYKDRLEDAANEFQKTVRAEDDDHTWAFAAGFYFGREDLMSPEEARIALQTINDIASFVALRGLWNEPVPALIKLCEYLKERSGKV